MNILGLTNQAIAMVNGFMDRLIVLILNWSAPDTLNIPSTFDHYNLYCNFYGQDTTLNLIASLTDTFFNIEAGFIGEMWVTAVYSDPAGESEPSNIIINESLPISINENQLENEMNIFFDKRNQEVVIENGDGISRINIFNCQGKLIKSNKTILNKINIENYPTGLYIVEIVKNNQEIIRHKIIK